MSYPPQLSKHTTLENTNCWGPRNTVAALSVFPVFNILANQLPNVSHCDRQCERGKDKWDRALSSRGCQPHKAEDGYTQEPRSKVENAQPSRTVRELSYGWWYILVILATQEVKVGGSGSEASLGKSVKPYLKNKLKAKGLGAMLTMW
jgi:hypothetical protein